MPFVLNELSKVKGQMMALKQKNDLNLNANTKK